MKRFSQFVAILLMVCIVSTNAMGQAAATGKRPDPKAGVGMLGVGEDARITLKLKDGSELSGFVSRAQETDFAITDRKTRQEVTVTYSQVLAIKSKKGSWDYGVRARKEVAKAGIGTRARIDLKTREGTKIKGYIVQASEDTFVVADRKTGETTTLGYSDVDTIQRPKSLGYKIGVGAAVGFGVLMAVFAGVYASGGVGG